MSTPAHISPDRAAAERIVRRLRAHGFTAYFAGGCVRDELLGLTPDDYDVATDATPQTVRDIFKSSLEVGAHFGVVIVKIDGAVIEVATFRTDGPYSDRRRPDSVRFSTPSEDAARRDFTFNALFLDPAPDLPSPPLAPGNAPHPEGVLYDPPQLHTVPGGVVIDYVGGLPDLSARVLRAVGNPDHRLAEDHLRALRAARLAAKLGCTIHPDTLQAVQRHARELSGVSRERVGEEIRRMLDHPARASAAALLAQLHLTRVILGLQTDPAADAPSTHLRGLAPDCEWPTPLAAWLLDLGPAPDGKLAAAALRKPLCLSNDECGALAGTLDALARLEVAWNELSVAQRKRLAGSDHFGPALRLLRIRSPQWAAEVETQVRELSASHGGVTPAPLVTGDDLIAAGMRPGPGFKKVLDDVYDAQLEGRVRNQADAMELARRLGV